MLPLFMVLSWIFTVSMNVKDIVYEKEKWGERHRSNNIRNERRIYLDDWKRLWELWGSMIQFIGLLGLSCAQL